ncbi:MAG: hypothetical protein ACR2OO_11520 [Thermomicrobiales bacterium]
MGKNRRFGAGRGCAVAGCARRVAAGKVVCRDHARTAAGRAAADALLLVAGYLRNAAGGAGAGGGRDGDEGAAGRWGGEGRAEGFRRRLERGEYAGLFEGRMREVMAQAAAAPGLAEEIGILRVAMTAVLLEEGMELGRRVQERERRELAGGRPTVAWRDAFDEVREGGAVEGEALGEGVRDRRGS